jgi:5-methylcytosine-specific restriction protein A
MTRLRCLKPGPAELPRRVGNSFTQATRIRGSELDRIRREHFARAPLCVHCQARGLVRLAVELDHITPLWAGGRESSANRQGLCRECHAAKTAGEVKERMAGVK